MGPDAGKEGGGDWADPSGGAAEEVRCSGRAAGAFGATPNPEPTRSPAAAGAAD